jgi:hypothetical protein
VLQKLTAYLARHAVCAFLFLFTLSFLVRFTILMRVPRENLRQAGETGRIAMAIISKGQFADPYAIPTGPTAHTTPFFPLLLAVVFKIFGAGDKGHFARCVLNISSYSLLYALYPTFARAFRFPFSAGLLAGFISALLPTKASAEVFRGWEEPYSAMVLALVLFLTLRRWNSPRNNFAGAIWLGVCWGAGFYVSFSLFSVLVGLTLVDLASSRSWHALRDACLTFVTVFALLFPWLLRNHDQLHTWAMRDNLGLELRYSNHEHAAASSLLLNADPASFRLHPSNSVEEAMLVRDMGEVEYNRHEMHLATAWIAGHPADFIRLSLRRFFYFWFGPLEHPYELAITSAYTLPGLIGLTFIGKRVGQNQFRIWCTVLLFYPVLYYFVQYISRYRVPIDWLIWLSAGLLFSAAADGTFGWVKKNTATASGKALSQP